MTKPEYSERHKQQRGKNRAMMLLLLGLAVLFYLVFIARSGGL